jgi:hypothetical protein
MKDRSIIEHCAHKLFDVHFTNEKQRKKNEVKDV